MIASTTLFITITFFTPFWNRLIAAEGPGVASPPEADLVIHAPNFARPFVSPSFAADAAFETPSFSPDAAFETFALPSSNGVSFSVAVPSGHFSSQQ